MQIDASILETSLKDISYKISWRNVMLYAAAINDNNSRYLDDEREDGIIAHPMFPVTLTLPIVENLNDFINSKSAGSFPYDALMTAVHYSEYLKIHRLIKPNDELTIRSKFVAMIPHRAGTHTITKLEAKDKGNQLVFTEYLGGMLRGVECVGGEKFIEEIPTPPINENNKPPVRKKEIHIDFLRPYIYDGCAGNTLPIHTSKEFAHQVGLPNIILQGVCTLALAVSEIINVELDMNPNNITDIGCKFTGMVIPDSNIRLEVQQDVRIEKTRELFFEVFNNNNQKAIREGFIRIKNG